MSTKTIGKYRIIRELGSGGMGKVYEAKDTRIGRTVALKVLTFPPNIKGEERQKIIDRFYREARAAGKLSYPNIVTIYEVGSEGGYYYIAMEYLEGTSLRNRISFEGPLPISEAVEICIQVCQALEYAHQHGVVHRDIKPDNIIILGDGIVKLTDFGIARIVTEPSMTSTGTMLGSPAYMSPEQIKGQSIDGRSDIFSLGVTLYEMVSGYKPFEADSLAATMHEIVSNPPKPLPKSIPSFIDGIIQKALSKEPEQRYQSAKEMAEDLKNRRSPFLGPQVSVPPGPFPPPYQPAPPSTPTPPPPGTPQPQPPTLPPYPHYPRAPYPSPPTTPPPYGQPYPPVQPMPQPSAQPETTGCLCVLGFFMPVIGLIVGLIFLSDTEPGKREAGKRILIWSAVGFLLAFFIGGCLPFLISGCHIGGSLYGPLSESGPNTDGVISKMIRDRSMAWSIMLKFAYLQALSLP